MLDVGGIGNVAAGIRQTLDALSKRMVHPFVSRGFDDSLSVLLIRSSTSMTWNVIALGALLSIVALSAKLDLLFGPASSLTEVVLISYAVCGVLWNAFAALVHSASSGNYGRGLLLFAVWPLSFAYNWRETFRQRQDSGKSDAA